MLYLQANEQEKQMPKATRNEEVTEVKVVQEAGVTLELSLNEAIVLHRVLGSVHGNSDESYEVWNTLNDTLTFADKQRAKELVKVEYRMPTTGHVTVHRLFATKPE